MFDASRQSNLFNHASTLSFNEYLIGSTSVHSLNILPFECVPLFSFNSLINFKLNDLPVPSYPFVVVDNITATEYKTKAMVAMLGAIGAARKTLIVLPEVNDYVIKSCANIEGVKTTQWNTINVYDILNCDTFVVAKDAVTKIEEVYNK